MTQFNKFKCGECDGRGYLGDTQCPFCEGTGFEPEYEKVSFWKNKDVQFWVIATLIFLAILLTFIIAITN